MTSLHGHGFFFFSTPTLHAKSPKTIIKDDKLESNVGMPVDTRGPWVHLVKLDVFDLDKKYVYESSYKTCTNRL